MQVTMNVITMHLESRMRGQICSRIGLDLRPNKNDMED